MTKIKHISQIVLKFIFSNISINIFKLLDGETYWVNYQSDENGYRPKTGKGVGGVKPGDDAQIDPNLLKSLVG